MNTAKSASAGYDWMLGRAGALGGDLARILELEPPEGVGPEWRAWFYRARVDLIDLLYPDGEGTPLAIYAPKHRASESDALAVGLLADPNCELTISEIRDLVGRGRSLGRHPEETDSTPPRTAT